MQTPSLPNIRLALSVLFFVWFACLALGGTWGCAPELTSKQDAAPLADGPPETRAIPGTKVTTKELGQGQSEVRVNASDENAWIYFSFAKNAEVQPADPTDSKEWDLGFQRFKIQSNGGVSGKGGVEIAVVEQADFAALQTAPADGYITDQPDGDDANQDPDYAFLVQDGWYTYNVQDHTLAPRKRIYVVKATDSQYYKVQVTNYYDENGNSGIITWRWGKLEPPKK